MQSRRVVRDEFSHFGSQKGSAIGRSSNGTQVAGSNESSSLAVTDQQVAKMMEDDMGSAMQYLQGKGLCLMPISLASAISTATCHPTTRPILPSADPPSSPSISVLTVQSTLGNAAADTDISRSSVKDATSVSKP